MIAIVMLLIEFVLLMAIKSSGVMDIGDIAATALIFVFLISFIVSIKNSDRYSKYASAILLGFLLRIFFLYFDLYAKDFFVLPNSGADSEVFYRSVSESVFSGRNRTWSFSNLMSHLFNLIGVNRLYAQFLLTLFSIVAILFSVSIIDQIDITNNAKQKSIWILCLLPNFAILSSLFLRESLVMAFISISTYLMISWMLYGGSYKIICAIVSSMAACYFHSGSIGITIGCILCVMLYDRNSQKIHLSGSRFFISIILALGASFVFLRAGNTLLGKFGALTEIDDIAKTNTSGGSSYAQYVGNSNNPFNLIIFTIPRMVYFLFSPFPWQWRGISDIIAFFFSGLYYLIVIIDVIRFLFRQQGQNRGIVIGLLFMAFFTTFIFAWGTSNTGTAARHRDKMVCLYAIIWALSRSTSINEEKREERKEVKKVGTLYLR